MNSLNVEIKYQGVNVDVQFKHKWNMLSGYSGTGKTFLMHAVELFCMNNDIKSIYCDFRFKDYGLEEIKSICKNTDIVLIDNADLYLTNEILKWLKSTNKLLIICMKDTSKIDMENIYEYIVNYNNLSITMEEY